SFHISFKDHSTTKTQTLSLHDALPILGITQAIYPVPQHLKTALLKKLLDNEELQSVICFTRTKHRANRVAASLTAQGISCIPIQDRKSTRLNSSHRTISYAVFCLKKKK